MNPTRELIEQLHREVIEQAKPAFGDEQAMRKLRRRPEIAEKLEVRL